MGQGFQSWLHEIKGMFFLYLAVGVAFVPWGIVYSLFVLAGWDHWLPALLMLGGGFTTAHFVWRKLETRMQIRPTLTAGGASVEALEVALTANPRRSFIYLNPRSQEKATVTFPSESVATTSTTSSRVLVAQ